MTEREMFPKSSLYSGADVLVTIWNEESIPDAIGLATQLRQEGIRVDLYPEVEKVGKQLKYAAARGIPFVTVVGEDERARGEVSLKNMSTGEQISVSRDAIGDKIIKARLLRQGR